MKLVIFFNFNTHEGPIIVSGCVRSKEVPNVPSKCHNGLTRPALVSLLAPPQAEESGHLANIHIECCLLIWTHMQTSYRTFVRNFFPIPYDDTY